MKLIKTSKDIKPPAEASQEGRLGKAINRRTFMRRTGLTLGGGAIATGLAPKMVRRARADQAAADDGDRTRKRDLAISRPRLGEQLEERRAADHVVE